MRSLNHCRFCKLSNLDHAEPLAKYGVRHHAHFSCGLNRWGETFLTMIPKHAIGAMPYRIVDRYDLRPELGRLGYLGPAVAGE